MRFLRECRRLCAALSGMRKLGNVQELEERGRIFKECVNAL